MNKPDTGCPRTDCKCCCRELAPEGELQFAKPEQFTSGSYQHAAKLRRASPTVRGCPCARRIAVLSPGSPPMSCFSSLPYHLGTMDAAPKGNTEFAIQAGLLRDEKHAWETYRAKSLEGNAPQAQLDQLLLNAAEASAAVRQHIEQCEVCKAKASG